MTILLYLLIVSLTVAACGLWFFLWSLRSGQDDDLDGAANRILFMEAGEVVEEGTPAEMVGNPSHARMQSFLRLVSGDFEA